MVTRDILYLIKIDIFPDAVEKGFSIDLEIDTYPEVVMKMHFILLALVMYLLADGLLLAAIPLLDNIMIHWICWF